jgi:hypothetical protein
VVDAAGRGLVVAREAGEDRQAGGVGGGEAIRPQAGRAEVPDHAAVGIPVGLGALLGEGTVELEELAALAVHSQHVPVAV